jgi:hypothetical protein
MMTFTYCVTVPVIYFMTGAHWQQYELHHSEIKIHRRQLPSGEKLHRHRFFVVFKIILTDICQDDGQKGFTQLENHKEFTLFT